MSGLPKPKINIERPVAEGGLKTYELDKGLQQQINTILKDTLESRHFLDPHVIAFINHYTVCRHAGEAARLSGMDGHSGRALLKRVDIMQAVQKIAALEVEKYGFTAEDVVERQKEINDFDPIDLVDDEGRYIIDLRQLPGHARRVIKEIDVQVDNEKDPNGMLTGRVIARSVKYKFYDKTKSGELLSREKGVFKEQKTVVREVGENMRSLLLSQAGAAQERLAQMRNVSPVEGDDE